MDERSVSLPRSRFQLGHVNSHELRGNFLEQCSFGASFQLLRTRVTACRGFRKNAERLLAGGLDCPGLPSLPMVTQRWRPLTLVLTTKLTLPFAFPFAPNPLVCPSHKMVSEERF